LTVSGAVSAYTPIATEQPRSANVLQLPTADILRPLSDARVIGVAIQLELPALLCLSKFSPPQDAPVNLGEIIGETDELSAS